MIRVTTCLLLLLSSCAVEHELERACDHVAQIRVLPHRGEPVDDPAYRELRRAGAAAVPCLIEKLVDTTPMEDPRRAPSYSGTAVGDVAFFILSEITGAPPEEVLPADLIAEMGRDEVYGYFGSSRSQGTEGAFKRVGECGGARIGSAALSSVTATLSVGQAVISS